ncbi:TetR/AcrR family transcriptional regulator [Actinomadura logoneensis]|uniref:TetR/AcrR family transcriptional regulator n=1 Tax=Actinomadura logoneensis TaxID=2293572 RepID=A0A372JKG3_9ACTN|nr:TetR/AcrR family transcriptional regulator [Actinomadura logoneensis]RFU40296.1 TetR/AcrR family transcriptional regulator [Actinomadura logoneensis]
MADDTTPPARRRILDAADELFYAHGINSTGVDAVIETAGVARMTFYKHFGGKQALIMAYLEGRETRWQLRLQRAIDAAGDDPRARLLAVFDALSEWARSQSRFRGCSFVNALAELAEPDHPARAVVQAYKSALRDCVLQLAQESGAPDPALLTDQLLLVYEGAISTNALGNVEDAVDKAHFTAEQLINAAVPVPR